MSYFKWKVLALFQHFHFNFFFFYYYISDIQFEVCLFVPRKGGHAELPIKYVLEISCWKCFVKLEK